jgi:hypothetical protein
LTTRTNFEPIRSFACVVSGCRRLALGLYCARHLRELATLEGDDDAEKPVPERA